MNSLNSIDLDTPLDWQFAEFLIEKGFFKNKTIINNRFKKYKICQKT